MGTADALLLDPGNLVLDLGEDQVEGGGGLGRGGVRFHEVPFQVHDHFADLVVGDAAVPKLGEVDLDAAGIVGELRDLADLLAGELAQPRRYVDVLPSHHDVHEWTFIIRDGRPADLGRRDPGGACERR